MLTRLRFVARGYRYRLRVDPAEIGFLRRKLRRGQVAVDVGCHKGAFTYWMRRQAGSTGRVVAFEPQPLLVEYLRRAFAAMHYQNVVLEPRGLSDQRGSATLWVPATDGRTSPGASLASGHAARGAQSLEVELTTLDDYFAGASRGPDLIKIDVEGHELEVLAGGQNTLAKFQPTLLIECERRHRQNGQLTPVWNLLQELGYQGAFFANRRRLPLADFRPAVHQPQTAGDYWNKPGYVNNFIFEHPARGGGEP